MKKLISEAIFIALIFYTSISFSQSDATGTIDSLDKTFLNWYNLDLQSDAICGASIEKTYNQLLKDKRSKAKIIVAVIDGGVDVYHEDLAGKIWTNKDEIPNNNIDDDGNGYIDDIHGWNFIGNENGENVSFETLEEIRVIRKYQAKFKKYQTVKDVPIEQKMQFETYIKCKEDVSKKLKDYNQSLENIKVLEENLKYCNEVIAEYLGKKDFTKEEVCAINSSSDRVMKLKNYLCSKLELGLNQKELDGIKEYFNEQLEKHLNKDFNPRQIVGDDPSDIKDINYGNSDVKGPKAGHGTFVAGIIAANRNNNIGINGIAENVEIMALRAVPKGDERDKDVALAIKYAVDNGARIINMSFGKNYSLYKPFVDEAIKYAEQKGVLLVHAAGNSSENMDAIERYPTKYINEGDYVETWINVGANSKDEGLEFCGEFSNYGEKNVDLFAPGVNIISLQPENKYAMQNGTSFASPVASGVAALILSYYPELSATQLKDIMLSSVTDLQKLKVYLPSSGSKKKKTKMKKLCKTGGLVNAFEAMKLAEKIAVKENSLTIN